MARRYYSSTAARTTLATGVDDTTTTLSVTAVSGWPSSFPYTLIIDADTVNEEIVEVSARSGTTLTVTRGVDGTSAVAHSSGAAVQHGVSARDFDEPNAFINGTGTVTETLLASGAVTEAKLGTGAVTSAKILDGTIVNADINASAAIAQSKIADLTSDLASKLDATAPVGKILQVVTTNKTDTSAISTSAGTFTSDVMTVAITPSATGSKIVMYAHLHGASNAPIAVMQFRFLRNGTPIGVGDSASNRGLLTGSSYSNATGVANMANVAVTFVDSPSTTSLTTYSIQMYNSSSVTRTLYINRTDGDADNATYWRTISTMTVMEVAA